MKNFILLILMTFSFHLVAADRYINAEGRFWAKDDDNLVFVKNQLLYNAFVEVISKELKAANLDAESFWQKYDQKFNESFKSTEEKLAKKYGLTGDEANQDISQPKKEEYLQELRRVKLEKKRNYGSIQKLIRSFAIKKMSRSPQYPQSRFISIEAKVDKVSLNKVYYRFMREKQNVSFESMYLYFDYNLKDASWSDLGVDSKATFVNVVNDSWEKWFQDNRPSNVKDVYLLSEAESKELDRHFSIAKDLLGAQVNSKFRDSIALIVRINISKKSGRADLKTTVFGYDIGLALYDLSTNTILDKADINGGEKTYGAEVSSDLSNLIANYLYRVPLSEFGQLAKKVADVQPPSQIRKISLSSFKNMEQVFRFGDFLEENGVKLRLKTELGEFSANESTLIVYFNGDETNLINYINSIKSQLNNTDMSFDIPDANNPLGLSFVKLKDLPSKSGVESSTSKDT